MEHIRIAIRDSTDSMNICFLDNKAGIKFHESTLQRFLKGTCNFLTLKFYGKDIDTIYPGCRLAFKDAGNDYWLTINSFEKNGYECSLTAYSLSLETNKEKRKAFKAPKWTFKQYLDYVDPEHSLTLGLNEVEGQSMQLEWSGTDTILARLFSIANSFGAELEFVTELNDDYSLKRHVLNVYKIGNIGKDKIGMPIRVGKSLKVINYTANIDELYTAIRVHGKDGLTIAGLNKKVYDSDKKLLYYTQGDTLYAPQARDRFPSIAHKASDSFICLESEDTDHSTKESLYAYMLGEIKKHSEPKIDYETEGYVDGEIGDRMLLIDSVHYDPPLYVEARISEQTISLLDKSKNKTVFTNYERKKSEIANELLAKMTALIEENKVYDVQILTSNGYSFKNGQGSTTLTARVMDGAKDVTNEFSLTWFKNSTEYARTASINVQAGSIDELATYLIIAEKDGRERGRNELTVFNVKDGSPGKTPVVHLAWADSADGTVKFTTELPTDWIPKYRGYYVDYTSVASTNPKLYKWERNPDDAAKVADEAKSKADNANSKADNAVSVANTAKDTADEASKQTALVNQLATTAKQLADQANADATEANRLIGLANNEIDRLNTDVSTAKADLVNAETDLNSKIETVKTTLTQNYATKTNLSDTQISLTKTINDSVASVKQEMSETYAVKSDLTTLQGEYNSFKEQTAKKISQQVSSIQTIQTDTTEAQRLASNAYSKANSAVTSASNASSTANSALSKASDATSVANSASKNANNAVASANSAVSTANTAKSNADKAIADVAALTKTVTTQSTRIDQTSSRIDLVASGVTEIGNVINSQQSSNINLWRFTKDYDGSKYDKWGQIYGPNIAYKNWKPYTTIDGFGVQYINHEWDDLSQCVPIKHGGTYTLSAMVKLGSSTSSVGWYIDGATVQQILVNGVKQATIKNVIDNLSATEYKRVSVTYKNFDKDYSYARFEPTTNSTMYMYQPMFNEGYPLPWSPHPEDQQSQIDGINNNLSNNYYSKTQTDAAIKVAADNVTTTVRKEVSTEITNVNKKVDNIQVGGRNLWIINKMTGGIKETLPNNHITGQKECWRINNGGAVKFVIEPEFSKRMYGKTFTFSVWVKYENVVKGTNDWNVFNIFKHALKYKNSASGTITDTDYLTLGFKTGASDWKKVTYTHTYDKSGFDMLKNSFRFNIENAKSGTAWITGIQIEEGNIVSDYHLSEEDAQGKLDDINNNLSNNYYAKTTVDSKLSTTVDGITANYNREITTRLGNYYDKSTIDSKLTIDGQGIATYVKSTKSRVDSLNTQYTQVKQLADQLSATVYDSASGLVTKTTQLAGKYAIENLNSAGDILTSLNLNANDQTAEINAKLIRLNGYTKMDDAFINNLVANSILTEKIKSTEISGDIIKGGTIQGVNVRTSDGRNLTDLSNGGLTLTRTEPIESNFLQHHYGIVYPTSITMSVWDAYSGQPNTLNGKTTFDPSGFYNVTKDSGGVLRKRSLIFNSEGIGITPENIHASDDIVNTGDSLNTGIRLYGKRAYLDLNGNQTSYAPGTVSRIISEPDGRMEIVNYVGNIHLNTRNGENPISNGYKIPYTWAENTQGIKYLRVIRPNESNPYIEVSNHVGKLWGVNMWLSDQRLKSNIATPTQDALSALNQLKVRQFDWKSDNAHEDFGLIAQEVEQILPNAVFKVGDYYQIKDSGLIPVLIGAVQKLSNKVNLLENIIYNTKGNDLL